MFRLPLNLYYPDTSTGTGGTSSTITSEMNHEDVIDFLGEDEEKEVIPLDDKKDKDKEKEKKDDKKKVEEPKEDKEEESQEQEESEEVEDELEDLEQELEGPTEEQLELVTPVRRREILKKYPNLFKEFPYLEKAYYREQQFTELLPTIEDAKEAVEAKGTLEKFEADLMGGNTETILRAVKNQDTEGFKKIVNDYLPALSRVDKDAFLHVIGNVSKHIIMGMVNEAKSSNNEALLSAAQILNQYVTGSSEWKPPSQLPVNERKPEDNKVNEREQRFISQQFESTRVDLNTKVNNTLKNTIDAHLDPKQSMTDYVRRNASRDAIENLETLISKDTRFRVLIDKMWERAFKENFSESSKNAIKSAYLSKAKTLLPTVIKKARIEALKGVGRRVTSEEDVDTDKTDKKGPIQSRGPRSQETSRGKVKDAKDIPKGMTTLDFLNSD